MTLLQLCEPLFQYICQLNYTSRKGATYDYMIVRREVEDLLTEIRTRAAADPTVAGLYDDKMELALIFFVDNVIATSSSLPFARDWGDNRIAYERHPAVMTGDADFFSYFQQTLGDRSEAATQKLAVYFTAVGLGMTGEFSDRPDQLRRMMIEASRRLAPIMDGKTNARICPDAGEWTNTEDLRPKPVRPPVLITIALVGLIVMFFGAFVALYRDSIGELNKNLQKIEEKSRDVIGGNAGTGAPPPPPPPSTAAR